MNTLIVFIIVFVILLCIRMLEMRYSTMYLMHRKAKSIMTFGKIYKRAMMIRASGRDEYIFLLCFEDRKQIKEIEKMLINTFADIGNTEMDKCVKYEINLEN